jgi:hypothetical protein
MDHPAEIVKVERNLAKLLKKGFTLDELEDIEAEATEVGRLVQGTDIWPNAYQGWMDYRETLPDGVKLEAEDAFYRGYVL